MKSYRPAVVYLVSMVVIAHLVAGDQYMWRLHSISQLGAQTYRKAWIMRAGFIGFGLLLQVASLSRMRSKPLGWVREVPVLLYGLAIFASGIFSAEPFVEGMKYSEMEAQLHGMFATAGGILLSLGMLVSALIVEPRSEKTVHASAFVLTITGSFLFFAWPELAGLIQRLLWVAGFSWLVYLG